MRDYLQRIATGPELSKDLTRAEARDAMRLVLEQAVDPVRAGVFLIALRMKRESDEETRGVLEAIREKTARVESPADEVLDLADPYDGYNKTLPIAAFLPATLAACGVATFSHGVESVGPKFGATHRQVLRAAGVRVDDDPRRVAERLADPTIGWGYVDQRHACPALHALLELRRLIVKRPVITTTETLAGAITGRRRTHLLTGYVHKAYPRIYALLARHAGYDSALLVRGTEGGVIPSLRQTGKCWRYVDGGEESALDIDPASLGIHPSQRAVLLPEGLTGYRKKHEGGETAAPADVIAREAARAGLQALNGTAGPAFDALTYAGALCLSQLGREPSLERAAGTVRRVLGDGKALAHFER